MEASEEAGPRRAVAAAMIAAAALIAQQVAGRATRDALFLSTFHVSSLPLVMMAAAAASAVAVLGFSTALTRRSPARVLPLALGTGTVLLLAEWGLCLVQPRLAAIAVYLHMAVFGATVISGFWSLVNERFDPHTARRVMGDITLGASLGGVGGGLLAWSAARVIPVPAMLAVMAAFNVVCLLALTRLGPPPGGPAPRADAAGVAGDRTGPLAGLQVLKEVPYLQHLALIVALGAATETLLDFLLNARAAATYARGPALMSFFALFHAGVGWLALAAQMSLSRPSLRRLGLAGTVSLRPGTVMAATVLGLVEPSLWSAVLARGVQGVIGNSLFRSGYELLFTPIAERRKRPTKTIVDVGFDKLGTVVASAAILLVVPGLGDAGQRVLYALAAAASLAALAVCRWLHHGYVRALEDSLRSGVVRLEVQDAIDATTSMTLARTGLALDRATLLREVAALRGEMRGEEIPAPAGDALAETVVLLRSKDAEAVRRGLRRVEDDDPVLVGHLVPLLARNDVFLDVLRLLRRASPRATGQLLDALLDRRQDVTVRRRIPRVLRRSDSQRAADGLLLGLDDPSFGVRRQCAMTLARMTERTPSLVVPRAEVFAATVRELALAPRGWEEEAERGPAEDTGAAALTPAERGLAHVFTLLSLAVEREPLQIAHRAVLGQDPSLRGTALEYLENVLPDDVRRALWPHLGGGVRAAAAPRPRQNLVQDLLRSGATMGMNRADLKREPPD